MTDQTGGRVAAGTPTGVAEARREERLPRRLRNIFNIGEFEPAARKRLPRGVFSYISGSVETGAAFKANRSDFEDIRLVPRILAGLAVRDQSRTLFGKTWKHPFGISPMGLSALTAYDGDIVLTRSAHECGIPAVLSATSLISLERVARKAMHAGSRPICPATTRGSPAWSTASPPPITTRWSSRRMYPWPATARIPGATASARR